MNSTSTTTSLTFKPWTANNGEESNLKAILERIHSERGHFRDITEASLQEEIAAEGAIDLSSSDDEEEEEDEPEARTVKRQPAKDRGALFVAKQEMLAYLAEAIRNSKNSLWFVAMLLSKYQPGIAGVSLPPEIKSKAPYGSVSADVWDPKQAMPQDAAREAQDKLIATNMRMRELQDSADGLLAAATRLKENVRQENMFWDEILSVSERGWKISKIPGSPFLGVHYGFQGSDAAFARSQVAAILSDSDGNITLERGIGTQPKAVRTVLKRDGSVVGSSSLPHMPIEGETTLETRIRHARDSVFDEELFHEMLRESRSLTSMGVTTKDSAVHFTTEVLPDLEVEMQLVSLDEDNSLALDASNDFDTLAHAILLAARLLLGQEHRNKLSRKREVPPPMSTKEDDQHRQAAILRPLTLFLNHYAQVQQLNAYLNKTCELLRIAGVSAESQAARLSLPLTTNGSTDVQDLVSSLSRPLRAEGVLWLIASDALTLETKIAAESFVRDTPGPAFTIQPSNARTVRLFSLQELLLASDDFLALTLAQLLKEILGEEWALDRREGTLTRTREVAEKDVLKFEVQNGSSVVTLQAFGSQGRKEVTWKADGSSGAKPLAEAWKDLVD